MLQQHLPSLLLEVNLHIEDYYISKTYSKANPISSNTANDSGEKSDFKFLKIAASTIVTMDRKQDRVK